MSDLIYHRSLAALDKFYESHPGEQKAGGWVFGWEAVKALPKPHPDSMQLCGLPVIVLDGIPRNEVRLIGPDGAIVATIYNIGNKETT